MTISPAGWNDQQAHFYAQSIADSEYANAVSPLLCAPYHDVLDIGAGSGALTLCCLASGARWHAVEPSPAMQAHLGALRASLTERGIALEISPSRWQDLPPSTRAATLLAANVGATHHEPVVFFDAMHPRFTEAMHWVVAAQAGPSTFCLAGFLPPSLHGADTRPAYQRTLACLGETRKPHSVQLVDWRYRATFASVVSAQAHFLDRLGLLPDTPRGRDVLAFIKRHVQDRAEGVIVEVPKRSAVMSWTR